MNFLFYSGKQKEHAMPVCLVLRFNFHSNLLTVFTSSFGCRHSVTEKTKKKKKKKTKKIACVNKRKSILVTILLVVSIDVLCRSISL